MKFIIPMLYLEIKEYLIYFRKTIIRHLLNPLIKNNIPTHLQLLIQSKVYRLISQWEKPKETLKVFIQIIMTRKITKMFISSPKIPIKSQVYVKFLESKTIMGNPKDHDVS